MAFYKAVLNGQMNGQAIRNILYYRTGVGIDIGGLQLGGAPALAQSLKEQVWDGALQVAVSEQYVLESIDITAFNDTFQLLYTLPYTLPVGEQGNQPGESLGPAACIMVKFGFDSQLIGLNLLAPRKGYVVFAGLIESAVNGGRLVGSVADESNPNSYRRAWKDVASALAQNIESISPPVVWFPVRVKRLPTGLFSGWADISNAVYEDRVLWRRSRQLED
jgi:hypothetical protein